MNIKARIFIGILFVSVAGFAFFLWWIVSDLEPEYRKATEEPLIDSASLLASTAAATVSGNRINTLTFERIFEDYASKKKLYAKIYDYIKKDSDLRVYITDSVGIVLFDSHDPGNVGKDFSRWMDVYRTLRGVYGARTTRDDPVDPSSTIMYVAAPIMIKDRIAGVLTVGKPTQTARLFMERSRRNIIYAGIAVVCTMLLVAAILSAMITRPVARLTEYARAVRDGEKVVLPPLVSAEIKELGSAFEEMRDALEGKQYVERYVQTLTHEVKGPLSAIKGSVELLDEDMPPEQRKRFNDNIRSESERIGTIIEQLLLLSSLESRKTINEVGLVDIRSILNDIRQSLFSVLKQKQLNLDITADGPCIFEGDSFLIRYALANLLQNSIDFSPAGGRVAVTATTCDDTQVEIRIVDNGPGIPDYALGKVYERFYSLKRPDTGKKSSGLGLSIVREIMLLHHGTIDISNNSGSGTIAVLRFPSRHSYPLT